MELIGQVLSEHSTVRTIQVEVQNQNHIFLYRDRVSLDAILQEIQQFIQAGNDNTLNVHLQQMFPQDVEELYTKFHLPIPQIPKARWEKKEKRWYISQGVQLGTLGDA